MTTARSERVVAMPPRARDDFYERALLPDERPLYREAHEQRDLHGEVALLRLRLYQLLRERAGKGERAGSELTGQIARIIELLVKALRTQGVRADRERDTAEWALDERAPREPAATHGGILAE